MSTTIVLIGPPERTLMRIDQKEYEATLKYGVVMEEFKYGWSIGNKFTFHTSFQQWTFNNNSHLEAHNYFDLVERDELSPPFPYLYAKPCPTSTNTIPILHKYARWLGILSDEHQDEEDVSYNYYATFLFDNKPFTFGFVKDNDQFDDIGGFYAWRVTFGNYQICHGCDQQWILMNKNGDEIEPWDSNKFKSKKQFMDTIGNELLVWFKFNRVGEDVLF